MEQRSKTDSTNAERQRRFVAAVWNDRDLDAISDFVDERYVLYDPNASAPIRGRSGLAEYLSGTFAAFSDLGVDLHLVLEDDDVVVTHYTVSGTHDGPLGRLPATGRRVDIEGTSVIRYADGRLVEERAFFDAAEFRRQLGLAFPALLVTVPRLAFRALRARL